MRLLFAIALVVLALLLAAWLVWVRPLWAGTTRCTTHEERTMQRLQTLCDEGTRGPCQLVACQYEHLVGGHSFPSLAPLTRPWGGW
jgi:hypothetical protein